MLFAGGHALVAHHASLNTPRFTVAATVLRTLDALPQVSIVRNASVTGPPSTNDKPLYIGAYRTKAGVFGQFKGVISNVRLMSRALTSLAQATAAYRCRCS